MQILPGHAFIFTALALDVSPSAKAIGWHTGRTHATRKTMTDPIFDRCVDFLEWTARKFGTTYKAVNIWITCVLWPLITIGLIVALIWRW
jgi:hypothetical protein